MCPHRRIDNIHPVSDNFKAEFFKLNADNKYGHYFRLHSSDMMLSIPFTGELEIEKAQELIVQDFYQRHIKYELEMGFHDHFSHHMLAALTLGATPDRLDEIYHLHRYLEDSTMNFDPGVNITDDNIKDFVEDDRYYPNLVMFFLEGIDSKSRYRDEDDEEGYPDHTNSHIHYHCPTNGDWVSLFEKYFFHPDLVSRMMSGLMYPFLQIALGFEFQCELLVAQGLAMGCLCKPRLGPLTGPDSPMFIHDYSCPIPKYKSNPRPAEPIGPTITVATDSSIIQEILVLESSSSSNGGGDTIAGSKEQMQGDKQDENQIGECLMQILYQIRNDDELGKKVIYYRKDGKTVSEILEYAKTEITKYISKWKVPVDDPIALNLKTKELYLTVSLIYGYSAGIDDAPQLRIYLSHIITPLYFIPILKNSGISSEHYVTILKFMWSKCLLIYLMIGCPKLSLEKAHYDYTLGDFYHYGCCNGDDITRDCDNSTVQHPSQATFGSVDTSYIQNWSDLFNRVANKNNDMYVSLIIRSLWRGMVMFKYPLSNRERILLETLNRKKSTHASTPYPPSPSISASSSSSSSLYSKTADASLTEQEDKYKYEWPPIPDWYHIAIITESTISANEFNSDNQNIHIGFPEVKGLKLFV
ncbi:hypothetical protein H4219_005723 [Mycoemilia scoparia]|uniref:Uncharacterized protein n=1 Tax=Mycoemilia scoparia TaxID=417184 RepID=A0A9W8DKK0_9FUNG|nr:hypothetical protein H4219_005723 [Mycoemilia scoparia]